MGMDQVLRNTMTGGDNQTDTVTPDWYGANVSARSNELRNWVLQSSGQDMSCWNLPHLRFGDTVGADSVRVVCRI